MKHRLLARLFWEFYHRPSWWIGGWVRDRVYIRQIVRYYVWLERQEKSE